MKIIITFHCTELTSMIPKETLVEQMKTQINEMFQSNKQMKMIFTKADVEAVE